MQNFVSVPVGNSNRIALIGAEEVEVAHPYRLVQVVLQEHAVGGELDFVVVVVRRAALALHRRQLGLSFQEIDLAVQVELLRSQVHLPVPLAPAALVSVLRAAIGEDEVQALGMVEHQVVEPARAVEVLVEVRGVDEGEVAINNQNNFADSLS